eukprot:g16252.t1
MESVGPNLLNPDARLNLLPIADRGGSEPEDCPWTPETAEEDALGASAFKVTGPDHGEAVSTLSVKSTEADAEVEVGAGGWCDYEAAGGGEADFPKHADVAADVKKWKDDEVKRDAETAKLVDKLTDTELRDVIIGGGWGNSGYVGWVKPMKSPNAIGFLRVAPSNRAIGYPMPTEQDPDGSKNLGVPGMDDKSLALPANGAVANSWDAENARIHGWVLGNLFHFHGANTILGPGNGSSPGAKRPASGESVRHRGSEEGRPVFKRCVKRCTVLTCKKNPRNGRNFESFGGEDPVLGAFMAGAMVPAMTANGCLSTMKHYIFNDWEEGKNHAEGNANVPMPAAMELYVKPFVAGIAAGGQAVMCGYNEVGGKPSCGNKESLDWINNQTKRMLGAGAICQKNAFAIFPP